MLSRPNAKPSAGSSSRPVDPCIRKIQSVFDMHGVAFGSPDDLRGFLDQLRENKRLAMDFWSLTGKLRDADEHELSGDRLLGVILQSLTGREVAEVRAAGPQQSGQVDELVSLLAGVDVHNPLNPPPPSRPAGPAVDHGLPEALAPERYRLEEALSRLMRSGVELRRTLDTFEDSKAHREWQPRASAPATPSPPEDATPSPSPCSSREDSLPVPKTSIEEPVPIDRPKREAERPRQTGPQSARQPLQPVVPVQFVRDPVPITRTPVEPERPAQTVEELVRSVQQTARARLILTEDRAPAAPRTSSNVELLEEDAVPPAKRSDAAWYWAMLGALVVCLILIRLSTWHEFPAPAEGAAGVVSSTRASSEPAATSQVLDSTKVPKPVVTPSAPEATKTSAPAGVVEPTRVPEPKRAARNGAAGRRAEKFRSVPSPEASAPPPPVQSPDSDRIGVSHEDASITSSAGGEAEAAVNVPASVMEARLASSRVPSYPETAKASHVEGRVVLEATIAKDGSVGHLRVLEGDPRLRSAATEAVSRWRYRPYMLNGKPVEVNTTVRVDFRLPNP
ncbi:energy transducer TonB [Edaphobacter bradus]|uniref:energy transducer TonB n=1 Tax=Edaphobacter bradus TaxID=2259016 RepID=UPI0021DFFE27|nr:TonB family protein [Edaphobacter bradus]